MASKKWLVILCGACLLASYFLPWVVWDGSNVNGYSMASGDFLTLTEAKLGLANPFPKLNFAFYAFWLIPLLCVIIIFMILTGKKAGLLPFITTFLSLSLLTLYILFTDFGIGKNTLGLVRPGAWLHLIAAIGLVVTIPGSSLLKEIGWIIAGPVIVFASFKLTEKYMMGETHQATASVKADYTVTAADLVREFIANDSSANKKYLDKVLLVNGPASTVEFAADSTTTIKFADSTGSYAIFSLEKDQLIQVKNIKAGNMVSLKGVCSGSIFSEILGTTSISFKRGILNKNK